MAKKKTESSELGDDDFNFDDLDSLDEPMSFEGEDDIDSEDRNPSRTQVATELAKEAGSGFFEGLIQKSAKNVLPDEYDSGYMAAAELADYGKDVLDKNKQKVTKSVYRLGKEVKKILPFKVGLLERFLENQASEFEAQQAYSEEQARAASITSELSGIFDKQLDVQTQLAARQEAQEEVSQKERIVQTKMSADIMSSIDRSISRQEAFASQITKEYYRKSLELQFKSYFVQADTLKTIKDHYKAFSLQFTNIEKNTSLPEFVKLKNTERLQDMLRDQAVTSAYDQMFTNSKFMKNFKAKTQRYIDEKVSGVTDMFDSATDMLSNINDASEGNSGGLLAGIGAQMAGSTAGEWLADKIPESLRKRIKDNATIKTTGNYLSVLASSPSTLFSTIRDKLKDKSQELEETQGTGSGLMGKITGGLSDMFDTVTPDRPDLQIKQKDYLTHNQPAIFDNNVHRSITEVIPMYLAKLLAKSTDLNRMYRAVNADKTQGSEDSEELVYDYKKRNITTKDNLRESIQASVFGAKTTLVKSKQNASTMLSIAKRSNQEESSDSSTKKANASVFKDKKSEEALTNYLDKAKKKLGENASYQTLITDAGKNEELVKLMSEIRGAKEVIAALQTTKIDAQKELDVQITDSMRKYPLECIKQLTVTVSRIARSTPVNLITDKTAEKLSKAFTTYILTTGQDITSRGLLTQSAMRYLTPEDIQDKDVSAALSILITDLKKIRSLDEAISSSAVDVALAAVNTSLKQGIDITPQAFQTLADAFPSVVGTGELGVEQIVEGKLSTDYKRTYADISDLRALSKVTKTEMQEKRQASYLESLISNASSKVSGIAKLSTDQLRQTGGNPFKLAELAVSTALTAKSAATEAASKAKKALEDKATDLSAYINDNIDKMGEKTLDTISAKLEDYEKSLDVQIKAMQDELTFKETQMNEAKSAIDELSTTDKASKLIAAEAKVYRATTTANIKALQATKTHIVGLKKSVADMKVSTEALPLKQRIALFRATLNSQLEQISSMLKTHEDELKRIANKYRPTEAA